MGHGHHHHHDHDHSPADVPAALDLSVPDSELSPADVSRRGFLRGAGLLGAGAAATVLGSPTTAAFASAPAGRTDDGPAWLAGDHHIPMTE
jgi:hypothetical protein